VEDSRHAVAAAEAAGVALQIGFQRRFDPGWIAMRDLLAGGELGRLRLLRGSHRNARPPADIDSLGDLFVDVAVHELDAARWLGGEVAELFAMSRAGDQDLAATVALRLESGALGVVDVARDARYGFECSAEAVGSQATARIGHRHDLGGLELLRDQGASVRLPGDHAERHHAAYVAELEHFGAVAAGRATPRVTGEDAVAALELALLAARSAELGVPLAPAAAPR
jgi:myo-inositol 2-dehydrogenase / D-chiro-inositol 1-dehydrogenase